MTDMRWLRDPTGMMAALLEQIASLEEAMALYRYIVIRGQVLVSEQGASLFGTHQLATLFSLRLEELEGADLAARYGGYLEIGPSVTRYGERMEDASLVGFAGARMSANDTQWEERLAALGLSITDRNGYRLTHGAVAPGAVLDFAFAQED
jgi:hypothetical protein